MLYKPLDRKDWFYIIASHFAVEIPFSFPNIAITRRAMYDGNYALVFYLSYIIQIAYLSLICYIHNSIVSCGLKIR